MLPVAIFFNLPSGVSVPRVLCRTEKKKKPYRYVDIRCPDPYCCGSDFGDVLALDHFEPKLRIQLTWKCLE